MQHFSACYNQCDNSTPATRSKTHNNQIWQHCRPSSPAAAKFCRELKCVITEHFYCHQQTHLQAAARRSCNVEFSAKKRVVFVSRNHFGPVVVVGTWISTSETVPLSSSTTFGGVWRKKNLQTFSKIVNFNVYTPSSSPPPPSANCVVLVTGVSTPEPRANKMDPSSIIVLDSSDEEVGLRSWLKKKKILGPSLWSRLKNSHSESESENLKEEMSDTTAAVGYS